MKQRLFYIDSLRGIASLIVALFWHYQHLSSAFQSNTIGSIPPFYWFPPVRLFFQHGDVMVDLFFLLSGVVFSYTYRTEILHSKVGGYTFFIKRFTRLYPVHLLTLFLAAFLAYTFHFFSGRFPLTGDYRFDAYYFCLNLFFLQKGFFDKGASFNVPAWSLSIEAFMYLLFFLQSRSKYILYSSIIFVLIGVFVFRMRYEYSFLLNESIALGLLGFFTGCILYELLIKEKIYLKYRWIIIVFYSSTLAIYWVYLSNFISLPPNLIMIYVGVLLIAELHHNEPMRSLLNNKILILLGDISLSVYLIHVPIQFAILLYFELNHLPLIYNNTMLFILYGLSVVGIGWMVHVTVEKPAQDWLRLRMKRNRVQLV